MSASCCGIALAANALDEAPHADFRAVEQPRHALEARHQHSDPGYRQDDTRYAWYQGKHDTSGNQRDSRRDVQPRDPAGLLLPLPLFATVVIVKAVPRFSGA